MKRGRPKLPVDAITAAQGRAYVLSMLGYSALDIAKMEGVTERAIYDRIAKGREIAKIDDHLIAGTRKLYALINPAIKRLDKIIKNGSDRDALSAAKIIFDAAKITKEKAARQLPQSDHSSDHLRTTEEEAEKQLEENRW